MYLGHGNIQKQVFKVWISVWNSSGVQLGGNAYIEAGSLLNAEILTYILYRECESVWNYQLMTFQEQKSVNPVILYVILKLKKL